MHMISSLHRHIITSCFSVLGASCSACENSSVHKTPCKSFTCTDFSFLFFSSAVVSPLYLQLRQAQHAVECWIVKCSYSALFPPLLLAPCVALDCIVAETMLLLPSVFPSFSFYLIFCLYTVVLLVQRRVGDG